MRLPKQAGQVSVEVSTRLSELKKENVTQSFLGVPCFIKKAACAAACTAAGGWPPCYVLCTQLC